MGGEYIEGNVIELSITQHSMWHFANWQLWGRKEDWLAWRGLAGICTKEELVKELMQVGRDNGKLKREAAVKAMFENGSHPFLNRDLIEKRATVNSRCLTEYNLSEKGREKARETVKKTNLRREKCPHCDFSSNPGNLAKHVRQYHSEG